MKSLLTIAYLVLIVAGIFISTRSRRNNARFYSGKKPSVFYTFFYYALGLLITFLSYGVLTGIFPMAAILLLLAASILAQAIYSVAGAVLGFTLLEKKEKIRFLSTISGAQHSKLVLLIVFLNALVNIGFIVYILILFWRNPYRDHGTAIYIAFVQFTLSSLTSSFATGLITWPLLTNEFSDDDARNNTLASNFSGILGNMIMLLFPYLLFKNDFFAELTKIGIPLPSFGMLLSIPLLLFIVLYLVPFFIGVYKYRAQWKEMLRFRKEWLTEYNTIILMPPGAAAQEKLENKINDLGKEIERRRQENDLYDLYVKLIYPYSDSASGDHYLEYEEVTKTEEEDLVTGETTVTTTGLSVAVRTSGNEVIRDINKFFKYGKKMYTVGATIESKSSNNQVMEYLRNYGARVAEWDIRFSNLYFLVSLYKLSTSNEPAALKEYIKNELEALEKESSSHKVKKNLLAGIALSAVSGSVIWLLKVFDKSIEEYVKSLVSTIFK